MKRATEKLIAKEVIIFFSSVLIILFLWLFFWTSNKINLRKVETLQKQIEIINQDINTIEKSLFPKSKSFDEIFIDKLPEIFYEAIDKKTPELPQDFILIRKLRKYNSSEINKNEFENLKNSDNIRELYQLLEESNFNENDLSTFPNFQKNISQELDENIINIDSLSKTKPKIKKIFDFLKTKKYLTVSFEEFYFAFIELPLPPGNSTWKTYQSGKKKILELKSEIGIIKSNIYSTNTLDNITRYIIIVVFTIMYPIRGLFFLLIWALKTLRQ